MATPWPGVWRHLLGASMKTTAGWPNVGKGQPLDVLAQCAVTKWGPSRSDFLRPATTREDALKPWPKQNDFIGFWLGMGRFHAGRSNRHARDGKPGGWRPFSKQALDRVGRDVTFDGIAVNLGRVTRDERLGHTEFGFERR